MKLNIKIEWSFLRKQKIVLLELAENPDNNLTLKQVEAINGIINLIDAIQDHAVDTGQASSKAVFNF